MKLEQITSIISYLRADEQDAINNCITLSYDDLMLSNHDYEHLNTVIETELNSYTKQYEQSTISTLKTNLLKFIDLCKEALQLLKRLIAYTIGDYTTVLEGINDKNLQKTANNCLQIQNSMI